MKKLELVERIKSSIPFDYSGILDEWVKEAIRIRLIEQQFLTLFSLGKMNGTVHTCVGQEFSAVSVAGQLKDGDWVTSNHRCHGHFISKTKNWQGLIDELIGLKSGVCNGVGSSQHLFSNGFLSNGPQGALIPVAIGIAKFFKINDTKNIVTSFIGEGTLGEGVLYESLNLASLWNLPFLLVCENNFYSQSTPQETSVAGTISSRGAAFDIKIFNANTWDLSNLFEVSRQAIEYVRKGLPAILVIQTYRLNAHSKGDDNRDQVEVNFFKDVDPLNQLLKETKWTNYSDVFQSKIDRHIEKIKPEYLAFNMYAHDQLPRRQSAKLIRVQHDPQVKKRRMIDALNAAYGITLEKGAVHLGEDIIDPYGGAFKVTKGFSTRYPNLVFSTPISEAAITGVGVGLSLMGKCTFVEIMFGDFLTLCFDQILNNASKFYHMYGRTTKLPLRIRTPMGGRRGYGPTHSQSIEKFFVGVDNFCVIALTSLVDPTETLDGINEFDFPILIIENKVDYGSYIWSSEENFEILREPRVFGSLLVTPKFRPPTITLVSYGETARLIADNFKYLFEEIDEVIELVCLVQLYPLDLCLVERSVAKTNKLIVLEPGGVDYGIGAEVVAKLVENGLTPSLIIRIGSEAVPIPSPADLELDVVISLGRIVRIIKQKKGFQNA